jgi:hypothetical protein
MLHLLAGAVAGSIFKIRTLLLLLGFVLLELAFLAPTHGPIVALWGLANLIGLQVGYLAGIYARGALEQAGYSLPRVGTRRTP